MPAAAMPVLPLAGLAEWLKWLPQSATAEAPAGVPGFAGLADSMRAAMKAALRPDSFMT